MLLLGQFNSQPGIMGRLPGIGLQVAVHQSLINPKQFLSLQLLRLQYMLKGLDSAVAMVDIFCVKVFRHSL